MDSANFVPDTGRGSRTGLDEAILCSSKSVAQIDNIINQLASRDERALFTRLEDEKFNSLSAVSKEHLVYDSISQTAVIGVFDANQVQGLVAIVSAGTSDARVVAETSATLTYYGIAPKLFQDVGVAGLWRIMSIVEDLQTFPIIIAVAGMDAALPTVLAGLVRSIIIAVPTSAGYGVANGGMSALNSILSSCSPGITTVNIDNGFGAACAAVRTINSVSSLSLNADQRQVKTKGVLS
jgi:NCAIR mutase (PurE)-related protein